MRRPTAAYDAIIGVGAGTLTTPVELAATEEMLADRKGRRPFFASLRHTVRWRGSLACYGALKSDWIIMAANVSLALLCGILFFKIRGATKRSARKGVVP